MRLALFAFALTLANAASAAGTVHEHTLDNGLRIFVKQDRRAPVVVSQVWYKVGATYEHDGITGISHLLEHMMFKGTQTRAPGEFSRIIAALGGRENAFTGSDYTAYFQTLEKSRLETAFELEADRMRNLMMREEDFRKEVEVVKEERRLRTDDDPRSIVRERFLATAFLTSPARIPVIGWMEDLSHLRLADLQAWYERWYAPNNASLVVVGDVDPKHVFALAQKHFGPLKRAAVEPPKPRPELEQTGLRRIVVRVPAKVPYLMMGYKVPVLRHGGATEREVFALEMLAAVLDGGSSARFARNLVRGSRVAAGAGAGYDPYDRLEGLFLMSGTPGDGHDAAALEAALRGEIERIKQEPPQPEELERVRAQVKAQKVYARDSVFYQAMQIGMLETVGLSHRLLDEYLDRLAQVTPEDIQGVARRFFVDDRLTVAVLEPQPIESAPATRPASAGHRH